MRSLFIAIGVGFAATAQGQPVIGTEEVLEADRPEAWAMAFRGAAIQPLGVSAMPDPERGQLALGLTFSTLPHVSTDRRRVGFDGTKLEDLNKSPAFGALWLRLGFGERSALALAWTPPLSVEGARPQDLVAVALDFQPWRSHGVALALRAFHQRGAVSGDITCDRVTAGLPAGSAGNPFGCRAASRDRFRLRQTGLEAGLVLGGEGARWQPYFGASLTRAHYRTQVDAEVFAVRDRSVLHNRRNLRTLAAGLAFAPAPRWRWAIGLAWTPLSVRRAPSRERASDDLYSLNIGLWRTLR